MKSGEIEIDGTKVAVGSLSSYYTALEVAHLLADEIRRGEFLVTQPFARLPRDTQMKPLVAREKVS